MAADDNKSATGFQQQRILSRDIQENTPWTGLVFKNSNILTTIVLKIMLHFNDNFYPNVTKPGFCMYPVPGKGIRVITVETEISGLIYPYVEYVQHVWFNQSTGQAYQRIRLRRGRVQWIKGYKWNNKGVFRDKLQPATPAEGKKSPANWTHETKAFYPYPKDLGACRVISEPTVIFYLLSRLAQKDIRACPEICVFGKKQIHRLSIKQETSVPIRVSYKIHPSRYHDISGPILKAEVFSIADEPVPSGGMNHEAFSILGLQKDIRIYIDPSRHIPVQVSGINKKLGRLVFELKEAWIN